MANNTVAGTTFQGYIETTRDSLLIFEACKRGLLPRVNRRLQEKERQLVQSGAVFCFDENESGIKRWTDGLVWSPSRILGNFLVYRELDKRCPQGDELTRGGSQNISERQRERALVGSLTNSYRFKKDGLIKKSMSLIVDGVQQHLVSYYNKDDVLNNRLQTPSHVPALAALDISPELLLHQNFRIPILVTDMEAAPKMPSRLTPPPTPPAPSTSSSRKEDVFELNMERSTLRLKRRWIKSQQRRNSESSSSTSSRTSIMRASPSSTLTPAPDGCICGRSKAAQQQQQQQQQRKGSSASSSSLGNNPTAQPSRLPPPSADPFALMLSPSHHSNNNSTAPAIATMTTPAPAPDTSLRMHHHHHSTSHYGSGTPFFMTGFSDRQDQNPHQHLFSSTSLHAVNHSAVPMLGNEVAANAFMADPNYFLGLGWNEFEMQM
ncbi:camp-independent regulatory protein [Lichtheimia corymbifera JMRC:FSU:9682]|uniref:Camp-independent regulatory protein n=1 Tax=Lichtheimia corymbifera JMRC:FSU:9682 TaxID=1263082 RepID=A0A068SD06_9FUNG|nr:camp-independent regulatory protein [Lichtheimia corymbifera JMRC:FSU:9682]